MAAAVVAKPLVASLRSNEAESVPVASAAASLPACQLNHGRPHAVSAPEVAATCTSEATLDSRGAHADGAGGEVNDRRNIGNIFPTSSATDATEAKEAAAAALANIEPLRLKVDPVQQEALGDASAAPSDSQAGGPAEDDVEQSPREKRLAKGREKVAAEARKAQAKKDAAKAALALVEELCREADRAEPDVATEANRICAESLKQMDDAKAWSGDGVTALAALFTEWVQVSHLPFCPVPGVTSLCSISARITCTYSYKLHMHGFLGTSTI